MTKMEKINDDSRKSLGTTLRIFFAILGAIIIPVCIYAARSILTTVAAYPLYWQYAVVFIGLVPTILFSIAVAIIYAVIWRRGLLKSSSTNAILLLLAILCATVITYFAPVLPTREEMYFQIHRDEFEHQVDLMKQDLNMTQRSRFGIYSVGIYTASPSHAIVFGYWANSFKSEYAYVYAEQYSDLEDVITCSATDGSGGYGQIYATLSSNWYLCYRTAI